MGFGCSREKGMGERERRKVEKEGWRCGERKGVRITNLPLSCRCSYTNHHDSSWCQGFHQILVILRLADVITQLLPMEQITIEWQTLLNRLPSNEFSIFSILEQPEQENVRRNSVPYLDRPNIFQRSGDQRFQLWETFGVVVTYELMDNI